MSKINAVITGVGGYVPNYVLTNEEISQMVDTNNEWIMSRIGIKERRILKKEEGEGISYMAMKAVQELLRKTNTDPLEISVVVFATTTPDYMLPNTGTLLATRLGMKNAFGFDVSAACSGFIYGLEIGANFIVSGKHKKVLLIATGALMNSTSTQQGESIPGIAHAISIEA